MHTTITTHNDPDPGNKSIWNSQPMVKIRVADPDHFYQGRKFFNGSRAYFVWWFYSRVVGFLKIRIRILKLWYAGSRSGCWSVQKWTGSATLVKIGLWILKFHSKWPESAKITSWNHPKWCREKETGSRLWQFCWLCVDQLQSRPGWGETPLLPSVWSSQKSDHPN